MQHAMQMSDVGRAKLKRYEQLALRAYLCPAGKWTIGWGHTGKDVHEGLVITEPQAQALFDKDLQRFEDAANRSVHVFDDFPQPCFDALVSLAFNIGVANYASSTLVRMLQQHAVKPCSPRAIAAQFNRWKMVKGKVNDGLLARRADEIYTFATGAHDAGWE